MRAVSQPAFSETVLQLRAIQDGDRDAMNQLLARYLPWVRQTAALRLGQPLRDCQDLDDIVQQTLLDAFRSLASFEQTTEGGFRHWLAQVVLNNVRDAARRRGRHAERQVRGDSSSSTGGWARVPSADASPSQLAQANELEARIEDAMLRLTATHREILVLRDRCGMEYAEIASQLGFKNADTARALHHRAASRLQELLAGGA
jgi:RNA polymerase sigma-70 factor (ECF subfamily)